MKISFIGQKGIPAAGGGVERYVEDVATRLASLGHDITVYSRPNYTSKSLNSYKGVNIKSLPSLPTKHLDAISHTFFATIHALFSRVEVLHFQSIGPALLAWLPKLLNSNIKIVSTLQSRDYEHLKWGSFACFMLKLGERFMCRFSDELIVVTETMRQYVRSEYGLEAIVIPNGANLYESVEGTNHINNLGLKKDDYIVAISRLVRHKGLSYLIEAYNQITTDKKLVIVGAGSFTDDYVAEIKNLASSNSNIIFTGSQSGEALAELYSHASLFIQPSESEGLSLALLEAMSRKIPVLVSDISENTGAVRDGGFSFKNKDKDDLANKISYILAHPLEAQERAGKAHSIIEQYYNWETIVASIDTIYQRVATKKSPLYFYEKAESKN
jgi:glycosyltransferase involved in cell wall biosynthesis